MHSAISAIDPALTIEKLRESPENQYFERKSARVSDREVAHQISAMANASGGIIAIGIEDGGEITGVDDARENALRQVPVTLLKTPPQRRESNCR